MKNSKIADIKSSIKEHPKTSHKLSKTIKQAENVSQVGGAHSPIHSEIKLYLIFTNNLFVIGLLQKND